jgi:hypothetical protein
VTVELQRACKKETLPALVQAYHDEYPDAEIISDMVKARIAEFEVNTHLSAKGSNGYTGSDLIALYTNPSPALFGELGALNTRFGRQTLSGPATSINSTKRAGAIADFGAKSFVPTQRFSR